MPNSMPTIISAYDAAPDASKPSKPVQKPLPNDIATLIRAVVSLLNNAAA